MPASRLFLVRHGHATSGPDHRWDTSDPLTETGFEQARELAAHLVELAVPPTRVVSSPAVRALQTAEVCSAALDLPVETDERLLEFGSGAVTPFTLTELLEHLPYDDLWHPDDAGHDGETVGEFWRRVAEAGHDIVAAGGDPLVVSHGGTSCGLIRWALGIDHRAPDSFTFNLRNASVTEIELRVDRHGRRRAHLERIGDVSFLREVTDI
jgi:broad specificity phosphatase PhoE